eukprot:g7075.t1
MERTVQLAVFASLLCLCSLTSCGESSRHLTQRRGEVIRIDEENKSQFVEFVSSLTSNGEIRLAAGIIIELDTSIQIDMNRVTIQGESANENKPVIQCTSSSARIRITGNRNRLSNFVITNCTAPAIALGSPLDNSRFEVELNNVDFITNTGTPSTSVRTGVGSLLIEEQTTASVRNCSFLRNSAANGAGIFIWEPANVTISDSRFRRNSGGAIWTQNAYGKDGSEDFNTALIIRDSKFVQNEHRDDLKNRFRDDILTANGSSLESLVFIKFEAPRFATGAIFVTNVQQIEISGSEFLQNGAELLGAVFLKDNGDISITESTFTRNSPRSEDELQTYGGAIYYEQANGERGRLSIDRCRFIKNRAGSGGAIHAVARSNDRMTITSSTFRSNIGESYGGAIVIRNFLLSMRSTRFIENDAVSGGAMAIVNGGALGISSGSFDHGLSVEDLQVEFANNSALDGGALFLTGTSSVTISEARFLDNTAERDGGAVCLVHTLSGGSTSFRECLFRNNRAERGGAYFGSGASQVLFTRGNGVEEDLLDRGRFLTDRSSARHGIIWNKALAGGALYASATNPFQNELDISGVTFEGNEAVKNRSTLNLPNRHGPPKESSRDSYLDVLADDPCFPGGGGAACLVLNNVSPRAHTEYKIISSKFNSNSATVGGALLISTSDGWSSPTNSNNNQQESGNSFLLQNAQFQNNSATGAGGAIFCTYPQHLIHASNEDTVTRNQSLRETKFPHDSFTANSVHQGGYGPQLASLANSMQLITPESELTDLESGVESAPIRIQLLDAFNQRLTGGIMDAAMHVSVYSENGIASGELQTVVKDGYALLNVVIRAAPGHHEIQLQGSRSTLELPVRVSTRGCYIGERNIKDLLCELCTEGSYSFDTNTDCQNCPTRANCTGGAVLVPVEGYWHSTPFSPVMHDCLEFDACAYTGRQQALMKFYSKQSSGGNLTVIAEPFEKEYPQCRRGYRGVLCGSCTSDYGHVANGKCKSCTNESRTRSLVIFSGIWMLLLMAFTIRSALISIRDFIAVKSHALHSANLAQNQTAPTSPNIGCTVTSPVLQLPQGNGLVHSRSASGSDSLNSSPTFKGHVGPVGPANGNNAILASPPPGAGILNSPAQQATNLPPTAPIDHILAAEKIAETIKIFTNFLQITSVGIVINIEWTEVVKQMLTLNDGIAGFSNGSSIAPMECIVGGSEGERSIRHAILRIFMPFILMTLTVFFFALHWLRLRYKHNKPISYLRSRIIICALVASFFSYHKITEHLMRILNCMYLDHGKDISEERCPACRFYGDYAIARDYYWAEDTAHKCFEGEHAKLAYFLGFPGLILFSLGVPLTILGTLVYNKVHDRLHDIEVLNSFGFVYQNYKDRFMFWEVLIMCRKATVGAIVVFAYSLGGNLQSVMILGTLLIALLSQISAFPFNDYALNCLETSSLLVSILTFYFAIVFNDPNTSNHAKRAFSVILLLITLALLIAFFAVLVYNMDSFVEAKLKQMGHSVPQGRIQRPFKLVKVLTTRIYLSMTEGFRRHLTIITDNRRRRRQARQQKRKTQSSRTRSANGTQHLQSPPSTPGMDSGSYHTSLEITASV